MHTVYNNTHNTCKNKSKHSEMGPVRQIQTRELLGLFICVCIALCTIIAHNIAQNIPDNFPFYPPDNHHCSDDVYLREGGGIIAGLRGYGDWRHVATGCTALVIPKASYKPTGLLYLQARRRHCCHPLNLPPPPLQPLLWPVRTTSGCTWSRSAGADCWSAASPS